MYKCASVTKQLGTGQRAVMVCGWGGNCRPGGKKWQPTAGWMTYGHLQADCLYTGISSVPNARYRVWEAFTFYLLSKPCVVFLICVQLALFLALFLSPCRQFPRFLMV